MIDFKIGDIVNHKRYGNAIVSEIYKPLGEFKGGILLSDLSNKGKLQLNKDRKINKMPNGKLLERCFEDNLNLITKV
jgi:hypothetical protein